jgi:hypothetical protein
MSNYCSYCGRRGHNRRTCPHRSEEQKAIDKKWMKKSGPRKGSRSQCSYCGLHGHNRRTCPHLAHVRDNALISARQCVREALSTLSDFGVGPGALYEVTDSWRDLSATYILDGEVSVSFTEQYRMGSDLMYAEEEGLHPTFHFHPKGQKVYGQLPRERDASAEISIHYDVARRRTVKKCKSLLTFGTEESYPRTKSLGMSGAKFSDEQVEKLVEWAQRLVSQHYKGKDVKHDRFGHQDFIEGVQAELGY